MNTELLHGTLGVAIRVLAVALLPLSALGAQQTPATPATPAARNELSLRAERTINLDTDEGTWISLDVSPDGNTIVFDLLGDLYTMPIAGGTATALTSGMVFDAQLTLLARRRHVVFTSDRDGADNVWSIEIQSKLTKQISRGRGRDGALDGEDVLPGFCCALADVLA